MRSRSSENELIRDFNFFYIPSTPKIKGILVDTSKRETFVMGIENLLKRGNSYMCTRSNTKVICYDGSKPK